MSVSWHSLPDARLTCALLFAVLALAWPPAGAQNVNGSLAVFATILPPIERQETRLTAFRMARDGGAHVEMTGPVARSVSQIVMWTVATSPNGLVPVEQTPLLIEAAREPAPESPMPSRDPRATRLRFDVGLGETSGAATDSSPRNVTVRIHYLIVPGT
jgi:hypothetical protein